MNNKTFFQLITLLSIFCLFFSFKAFSQRTPSRNITIKDGLPSNTIYDIYKDSRGFIWLGTEAGLCRYDGKYFKIFTRNDGLAGNQVWSITEDTSGNLWLGCYGAGISMFNGNTFKTYSENEGLVNNNVRKIVYSKKHKGLLIGTIYGFSFFKDSLFINFKDTSISNWKVLQITSFIENESIIYLLSYYNNTQFIQFNPLKKEFKYLEKNHRFHLKSYISTCSFITSKKDTIIGNSIEGIKIYSKDTIIIDNNVGQIFDIVEDNMSNLWLASLNDGEIPARLNRGGIYKVSKYKSQNYNSYLNIPTKQCWSLYFDSVENVLWIGTLDKGIFMCSLNDVGFFLPIDYKSDQKEFKDFLIDSRNNLWINIGKDVIKKDKTIRIFNTKEFKDKELILLKDKYRYLIDMEGSFEKYEQAIQKKEYNYLNPYLDYDLKKIKPKTLYYPKDFHFLLKQEMKLAYCLTEDDTQHVWISSDAGIYNINILTNKINAFACGSVLSYIIFDSKNYITYLDHFELKRIPLNNFVRFSIIRLRKNSTFVSKCQYIKHQDYFLIYNNTDGVVKYKDGVLTRYPYLENQVDLNFNAMCSDKNGNLIVGTNTGKIYFLQFRNDSLIFKSQITQNDGIVGLDIRWVLIDEKMRLWFSTNKAIQLIDLNQFYSTHAPIIRVFNEDNGFCDLNTTKAMLDSSGYIYAMSAENFFRWNPDVILENSKTLKKIVFDRIDVNFKEYLFDNKTDLENWNDVPNKYLELNYFENNITFYFHLLAYNELINNQYSYKLKDLQKEWSPYTSETKAIFTYLSSGEYQLMVRGRSLSDPSKISYNEYSFKIRPPWWKTWWAYAIFMFIVGFSIFQFFRYRAMLTKRKYIINQRISKLKLEALKAQMNPHFIFNAFNSIQKYILQQDTKLALTYMSNFARLIRTILENSTKNQVTLKEEIEFLQNYLGIEKNRFSNFTYDVYFSEEIDLDEINIPPMLIQPIVENAIVHGIMHKDGNGYILIKFELIREDLLKCTVEDNGIGRQKSKEIYASQHRIHKSHGTRIVKERTELMNLKINYIDLVEDGIPRGTRVELFLNILKMF